MKLSIISVSFQSAGFIEEFVESVLKNLPEDSEFIVVDNSSSDETTTIIEKYPKVHLIKNHQNVGFSKGNNIGAKVAKGEYLLFLNPDIKVTKGAIVELLDYIENHSNVGLVAPRLFEGSDKIQESVMNFPTLTNAINEYLFNKKYSYLQYAPETSEPIEVEAVYGAAMLVPKNTFWKINGFDERYFLYYEDIDLCRRINALGLRIIYNPLSVMTHRVGASMTKEKKMLPGLRILALFFPFKSSGTKRFQIISGNIYHGFIKASLIRMIMYFAVKLRIYKNVK